MPKIYRVKKAQRNQGTCGNCAVSIEKGDPYLWWQFAYSSKSKRCMRSACSPRPSDLTNSDFFTVCLQVQEALDAELQQIADKARDEKASFAERHEGVDLIIAAYCIAAESMTQISDETCDKQSNLEEHFPGGSPTIELLEERVDWCQNVAQELEGAASECIDIIECCETCDGRGSINRDEADVAEGVAAEAARGALDECSDCGGSGNEESTEAKIEEACDHAMGIDWGGMA